MTNADRSDAGAPFRLDAHLHLWTLADGQYSWLKPAHGVLYDTFTPEQARQALAAQGVGQAILVQADDTAADTEAMLAAAAAHDWIVGVVGWLPLEEPAKAAALLERWQESSKFCGVRSLIHDDPRPNVLELDAVRESLALLSGAGIPFEVPNAFPRHLGQVADLATALPGLSIVVDHLAKPPRGGTAEQMQQWEQQIRAVAALPNTAAKVSGLHTDAAEFSAQAVGQVWDVALDAFGPQRLMFGGDWPVSLLGGSYGQTKQLAATLIDSLGSAEAQAIWAGTAQRVYKR
ncbi:MAG: amidohydrolase family protein [Specibacter sp.]